MLHSCLSRLVIIGCDEKHRVRADIAGVFGQLDGVIDIVRARARDDGNSARNALNAIFDSRLVLGVIEGRALARGTNGNKRVDALFYLKINEFAEIFKVDSRLGQGSDKGGSRTRENSLLHLYIPLEINYE